MNLENDGLPYRFLSIRQLLLLMKNGQILSYKCINQHLVKLYLQ